MMLNRTKQVLAGVQLPVLAAHHHDGIARQTKLAVHACDCGTRVVLNRLAAPSCPVCSKVIAMDATVPDNELTLTSDEMEEMKVVANCPTCASVVRATPELREALAGHKCHCPVCATVLTVSEDMGEDEESMMENEEPEMGDEVTMEDEESDMGGDVVDDSMEEDEGGEGGEEVTDFSLTENLEDPEGGDGAEEELPVEDEAMMGGEEDAGMDDETLASPRKRGTAKTKSKPNAKIKLVASPFATFLRNTPANAKVDMLLAGDKSAWYLHCNDRHIATAKLERASAALRPIFGTDNFALAFQTAAEDGLTEESAKDFGFEPVNIEVPVNEATQETVQQAVISATAALASQTKTIAATFERCLGIAAVGINKGVFGDQGNPVRTALVSSLTPLRVRNAESIVDKALAESGEPMMKEIVAKALDLVKKNPAALDEIAAMVAQAPFRFHATEAATDSQSNARTVVPFMTAAAVVEQQEVNAGVAAGGRDSDMTALIRGIRRTAGR